MIDVELTNAQHLFPINAPQLRQASSQIVEAGGYTRASISLVVVDDGRMRQLNRQHLDHDYTTDVLSFVLDDSGQHLSGEVIVCADVAHRQAAELETDPADELLLYVVHGTLHLVGYRDKTDDQAQAMRTAEQHWLAQLGLSDERVARLVQPFFDNQLTGESER